MVNKLLNLGSGNCQRFASAYRGAA